MPSHRLRTPYARNGQCRAFGIDPNSFYRNGLGPFCAWNFGLEEAGLEQPVARSFLAEVRAPLSPEMRESVAYCFEMFWGNLQSHVSAKDWDECRRLCDPESDGFVLNSPDYYGFLTYTLFRATVGS